MHIADGVISATVALTTSAVAIGVIAYSLKGLKEDEIPKISLLTGAFFVSSLVNIPVGPTSVHLFLGGLLGLVLGRRAPIGIFVGLILQATLFQHGGLSTLGANTLLMAIPALLIYWTSLTLKRLPAFIHGLCAGFFGVWGGVLLLVILLLLTSPIYSEGTFSVVNILIVAYLPLALLEGLITGFCIKYLHRIRPSLLEVNMEQRAVGGD